MGQYFDELLGGDRIMELRCQQMLDKLTYRWDYFEIQAM
jgi:hypothetical protein